MKQILINDAVALRKMIHFAVNNGCEDKLASALLRLLVIATTDMVSHGDSSNTETPGDTLAVIGNDFAAHSLRWYVMKGDRASISNAGTCVYAGGFIYEGPGQPLDGSAPALTVSLSSNPRVHSWGVHT